MEGRRLPGEELVYVRNVKKHFDLSGSRLDRLLGGPKEKKVVHAVDGVTLAISRNETLGLVGESGSGKSTFGRCVLGLLEPTSGVVLFDGTDVNRAKGKEWKGIRRRMQVVFQDPVGSLDPSMTVRGIVAEPLRALGGIGRREVEEKVEGMVKTVGLETAHLNRYPHEFSGGQRQRIGIARALITHPEFLVLDEPTSALDASIQAQILNLLRDLKESFSLTSLFITHNIKVVNYMSDRIAVMYLGKIVEIGPRDAMISDPLHPYTKMLIASIPRGDPDARFTESEEGKEIMERGGEVPSALKPPSGCSFHPRCPYAMARCKIEEPKLQERSDGRWASCFLFDSAES